MSTRLPQANPNRSATVIDILDSKVGSRGKPQREKSRRYDYWFETHQPLACLAFALPLLLWYDVSMILQADVIRSGIDRLLQHILWPLGDAGLIVLPLATIGIFLFLHHRHSNSGSFQLQTIFWMFVESLALATILFFACDAMMLYFNGQEPRPLTGLVTAFTDADQYRRVLTCIGASIHEELLFRMLLFAPLAFWIKQKTGQQKLALIAAAVVVSLVFAVAHCDIFNPEGYPFQLSTFLFRFLASVFLCFLFRFRGIAVAIGVHAVFDILAVS